MYLQQNLGLVTFTMTKMALQTLILPKEPLVAFDGASGMLEKPRPLDATFSA